MKNRREFLGEIAACLVFLPFLFFLLIFGNAVIPYQPSMHSEAVYVEARR